MTDTDQRTFEARVVSVDTVISLAIETLARQHGLEHGDASVAIGMRIADILAELVPHSASRFFETRVAVKRTQLLCDDTAKGRKAFEKAIQANVRATDRFYDEAMARFERLRGRQQ